MPLIDAHTHYQLKDKAAILEMMRRADMYALCSGGNKTDAEEVLKLAEGNEENENTRLIPTVGLHPWHVRDGLDSVMPFLDKVKIIGEIGLDTVWTSVPLSCQKEAFERQLLYAVRTNKPVILHTKGAEREVIGHISGKRLPVVIVHWYSGEEPELKDLIDLGCYFTLGQDLSINPAVQAVARLVPADRLLTETDGPGAVEWATGKSCSLRDIPERIRSSISTAAKLRGTTPEGLEAKIWDNFARILDTVDPVCFEYR
jgi:TatD DNase family protein